MVWCGVWCGVVCDLVGVETAGDTVLVVNTAATGEARGTLVPLRVLNRAATRGEDIGPAAQVA